MVEDGSYSGGQGQKMALYAANVVGVGGFLAFGQKVDGEDVVQPRGFWPNLGLLSRTVIF